MAQFQNIYNQANAAANQPYQPYGGQLVAGMNQNQLTAYDQMFQNAGAASPYFNQGANFFNDAHNELNQGILTSQQGLPYVNNGANLLQAGFNQAQNSQPFINGADYRYGQAADTMQGGLPYIWQGSNTINSGTNVTGGGLGYFNQGSNLINQGANTTQGALPYIGAGAGMIGQGAGVAGQGTDYFGAGANLIGQGANAVNAAGQPIGANQINPYLNPYQQQVTNATMANIGENNAQQQQQLQGNAAAQGALGGDRLGVAQAELARQQDLASNQTLAGLNQNNYQTALQTALSQQQAGMQAGTQVGQFGSNLAGIGSQFGGLGSQIGSMGTQIGGLGGLQGSLGTQLSGQGAQMGNLGSAQGVLGSQIANQGTQTAGLATTAAGVGQGLSGVAQGLSGLGNLNANIGFGIGGLGTQFGNLAGMQNNIGSNIGSMGTQIGGLGASYANLGQAVSQNNLTNANALAGAGTAEQQNQQAQLTANYQQYLQQLAYPYQQAQFLAGIGIPAAGGMGGAQTQIGSAGQVMTPPGMSWGQGALGAGALFGGLFGGWNPFAPQMSGTTMSGGQDGSPAAPPPAPANNGWARGGRLTNPYAVGGATPMAAGGSPDDDEPWNAHPINFMGGSPYSGNGTNGGSIQTPQSQIRPMPSIPLMQPQQKVNSPISDMLKTVSEAKSLMGLGKNVKDYTSGLFGNKSGTPSLNPQNGAANPYSMPDGPTPGAPVTEPGMMNETAAIGSGSGEGAGGFAGIDPATTGQTWQGLSQGTITTDPFVANFTGAAGMDAVDVAGLANTGLLSGAEAAAFPGMDLAGGILGDAAAEGAIFSGLDFGIEGALAEAGIGAAEAADLLPLLLLKRGGKVPRKAGGGEIDDAPDDTDTEIKMPGYLPKAATDFTADDQPTPYPKTPIHNMISSTANKYGINPDDMLPLLQGESKLNPYAVNPISKAKGLGQFMGPTARQYGLSNPFDPEANVDATARLWIDNKNFMQTHLGREPSASDLRLAHQQGATGATKLLTNPDARAADIVGLKAVELNGGTANMTAAQFVDRVKSFYGKAIGNAAQGVSDWWNKPGAAQAAVPLGQGTSNPDAQPTYDAAWAGPPSQPSSNTPFPRPRPAEADAEAMSPPLPQSRPAMPMRPPGQGFDPSQASWGEIMNRRNFQGEEPTRHNLASLLKNPATRGEALIDMGLRILAAPPTSRLGIQEAASGALGTVESFNKFSKEATTAQQKGQELAANIKKHSEDLAERQSYHKDIVDVRGRAGSQGGVWGLKYKMYLNAHQGEPDAEAGALEYASGRKQMSDPEMMRAAYIEAAKESTAKAQTTGVPMSPEEKRARAIEIAREFKRASEMLAQPEAANVTSGSQTKEPIPLPPNPSPQNLIVGQPYQTDRGVGTWNGKDFDR